MTDSQTLSITPTVSLTVNAAPSLILSPTTLPDATASTNYTEQLSAVGGIPPYIFSAMNLPAGLQINSSNQIAGQCTAGSTNVILHGDRQLAAVTCRDQRDRLTVTLQRPAIASPPPRRLPAASSIRPTAPACR